MGHLTRLRWFTTLSDEQETIQSLIDQKFLSKDEGKRTLLEKGEEAIAKIWSIHELGERQLFDGVSDRDREKLT